LLSICNQEISNFSVQKNLGWLRTLDLQVVFEPERLGCRRLFEVERINKDSDRNHQQEELPINIQLAAAISIFAHARLWQTSYTLFCLLDLI
jgi:hypothetical protein